MTAQEKQVCQVLKDKTEEMQFRIRNWMLCGCQTVLEHSLCDVIGDDSICDDSSISFEERDV